MACQRVNVLLDVVKWTHIWISVMPHNPTSNGITIRHWEGQGVSRTLERDMQMINTSFIWSWSVPSAAVRNEKEGGPHHQTQCQPCLFKKINFHNFIYVHLAY